VWIDLLFARTVTDTGPMLHRGKRDRCPLPFGLTADVRMKFFIAGFDDCGQAIQLTPATLRARAATWPRGATTPDEIAGLLKTSRDLYIFSYFAYEFLTVGVLVSLQAVEAALRLKLSSRARFLNLAHDALEQGLITEDQYERLDAGRQLRNAFSHPSQQAVWTYGMAAPSIEASHQIVADLFS
jgi:hypothetical protein